MRTAFQERHSPQLKTVDLDPPPLTQNVPPKVCLLRACPKGLPNLKVGFMNEITWLESLLAVFRELYCTCQEPHPLSSQQKSSVTPGQVTVSCPRRSLVHWDVRFLKQPQVTAL